MRQHDTNHKGLSDKAAEVWGSNLDDEEYFSIPMIRQFLCALDTIPDGGSKGATLMVAGDERDIFLVRRGEHVFAYLNFCPHTGATLNFQPDQFMSFDNCYIQCSIHGAQFRIYDGYCVYGPCLGFSLQRIDVEVNCGAVIAGAPDCHQE